MQKESDEKYDINEDDSEYHFSDEVGYESEDAEPEVVTPKVPAEKKKSGALSKLKQSKRILITVVVFFVLVIIFYKMVKPTSTETPNTNISSAPLTVATSEKNPVPGKVLQQPIAIVSPSVVSPSVPSVPSVTKQPMTTGAPSTSAITPAENTVASQPMTQPINSSINPPMTQPMTQPTNQPTGQENLQALMQAPIKAVQNAESTPATEMPAATMTAPMRTETTAPPTTNTMPVTSAIPAESRASTEVPTSLPVVEVPNAATATTQSSFPQSGLPATGMMGVQSSAPAMQASSMPPQSMSTQAMPPQSMSPGEGTSSWQASQSETENAVMSNNQMEAMTRAVAVENEKLVSQMQANYSARLSDYEYQNKALQSQVQSLNDRVITLESQLNQLVQALTRNAGAAATETRQEAPPPPAPAEDNSPRIGYNVQAIIPGRAWLRSDDGETITVTEGDLLRGVGRVTKIDPYNGVVEINTGNRIISLAYGGGS